MVEVQSNIKNQELVNKRRRQIIEASSKLFFEKGFDRTTMREISRASGLTMGSLYDYVRSKDDILVLVYKDVVERFRAIIGENTEAWNQFGPEDIEQMLRRSMRQIYKLSKAVQLLYRESWSKRKNVHLQMREIDRGYVENFTRLLSRGKARGELRVQHPGVTADIVLLLLALPALREWSLSQVKPEEVIDTVVGFIMQGLGIKKPSPPAA